MPVHISGKVTIPDDEIEVTWQCAQAPWTEMSIKVSSAIHLRFDIYCIQFADRFSKSGC